MSIFNTEKADSWQTTTAVPVIHFALFFPASFGSSRVVPGGGCTYNDQDGVKLWH